MKDFAQDEDLRLPNLSAKNRVADREPCEVFTNLQHFPRVHYRPSGIEPSIRNDETSPLATVAARGLSFLGSASNAPPWRRSMVKVPNVSRRQWLHKSIRHSNPIRSKTDGERVIPSFYLETGVAMDEPENCSIPSLRDYMDGFSGRNAPSTARWVAPRR